MITDTAIQRLRREGNLNQGPRSSSIPSKRAALFHKKTPRMIVYTAIERGQLEKAHFQLPSAKAQKERVNPQNGQG